MRDRRRITDLYVFSEWRRAQSHEPSVKNDNGSIDNGQ